MASRSRSPLRELKSGHEVALHSLSKTELNGMIGILLMLDEAMVKWTVFLPSQSRLVSLKPDNVKVCGLFEFKWSNDAVHIPSFDKLSEHKSLEIPECLARLNCGHQMFALLDASGDVAEHLQAL